MRPRIRTVKPEALKDEELWDLEASSGLPLYRAFQGLWMFADREGRFEWRPRALKSDVLPYWDGDFARCLEALERGGFVERYEVNGRIYGLVPSLSKHQRFDHREPQSILPPPPGHARAEENDAVTVVEACPGGREGKGTGREQEGNGTDAPARDASAPRSAQGRKTVWHNLDDWEVPDEVYTEAVIVGLPRDRLEYRINKLREGPIGGTRGVFNRTNHVKGLIPSWKAWDENDKAKAMGAKRSTADPSDRLRAQADRIRMLEEQESKGARETI